MGDTRKTQGDWQAPGARYGARFWDAVEHEIEALDASDFELFLAADQLPFAPRPELEERLARSLGAVCRARFSN